MKKSLFTLLLCFGLMMSYGQALKVDASGNVGVGNASPNANLEISSASNPELRLSENASTSSFFRILDNSANQVKIEKLAASGEALIDINPRPGITGDAWFRFFRETNTTGQVRFLVYKGNNTGTVNSQFGGNVDTYLNRDNGSVGIGKSNPTAKLDVAGDAYKTVGGDLWNIASDRRLKKGIKAFDNGLKYIMQMNPVEYQYNGKAGTRDGEFQIGVIAQDLQEFAPFMVSQAVFKKEKTNARGEIEGFTEEPFLSMNASAVKWMLVSAVKEQQEMLEEKDLRLEELEEKIQRLEGLVDQIIELKDTRYSSEINLTRHDLAELGQNAPNPFNGSTTVQYTIPTNATNAQMNFYNLQGSIIKTVQIDHVGEGQITVNAIDFPAGTYSYELQVDGHSIATKKMILAN